MGSKGRSFIPDGTECRSYAATAWHRSSPSQNHLGSILGFHGAVLDGTELLSAPGLRCPSHKTGPGLRTYIAFPGPVGSARNVGCLPVSYSLPCKYGHPTYRNRNAQSIFNQRETKE